MTFRFRRTPKPAILLGLAALVALATTVTTPRSAPAADDGEVTRMLPPSNTALLARASHAAARKLVAQVPLGPGTTVGLRQEGGAKLDADVREALLQAFNARKVTCVLLDPVAAPAPAESGAADSGAATAADPASPSADGTLAGLAAQAAPSEYEKLQAERAAQEQRADSIRAARAGAAAGLGGPGATSGATGGTRADLPVLTWRVQEGRVDYVRQFRSGLFGAHRIERRARADLALRLTPAGSDGVAWSASADTVLGDVVLKSEISALEDRTRPETRPVLPQSSVKKVIEPVLVVVLIAGLVSLFYQNRP